MRTLVFSSKEFSICKLQKGQELPIDLNTCHSSFISFSKTEEETSLIIESEFLTQDVSDIDSGWNMFYIKGTIAFSSVGVLSPILDKLTQGEVSILAVSTFDTDYVFFKKNLQEIVINQLKNDYLIAFENEKGQKDLAFLQSNL